MRVISISLLTITVVLQIKHFWDCLHINQSPQAFKMMTDLGMNLTYMPIFNMGTLAVAILVLFPQTFFIGNLLNSFSIVFIMAMALRAGVYSIALMEIPFLIIPLLLIWLKYPFKFSN